MEGWAQEPPGLENTGKGFLLLLGDRDIAHTAGRLLCRGSAISLGQLQELPHHLLYWAWPHGLAAVQPQQRGPREDESSCLVLLPRPAVPGGPVPAVRAAWGAAQCPAGPWGPGSPSPGAARALNCSSQGPGCSRLGACGAGSMLGAAPHVPRLGGCGLSSGAKCSAALSHHREGFVPGRGHLSALWDGSIPSSSLSSAGRKGQESCRRSGCTRALMAVSMHYPLPAREQSLGAALPAGLATMDMSLSWARPPGCLPAGRDAGCGPAAWEGASSQAGCSQRGARLENADLRRVRGYHASSRSRG